MPMHHVGRHRASERLNPVASLTSAVGRSAKPAITASAALVVSGGVVASIAAPAQAAPAAAAVVAAPAVVARPAVSTRTTAVSRVAYATANAARVKSLAKPQYVSLASSVLGTARRYSGIRYRWGGTTPRGFDCSGFTSFVFRKAGVRLPRTAAAQQRATRRVSAPRPGDLVFFGRPARHVGIYAGGGRMYDSPRRGKSTGLHKIWSRSVTYGRVR